MRNKIIFIVVFLGIIGKIFSLTTGKIGGCIYNEKKEPVDGVKLSLINTNLITQSDCDGYFYIVDIKPGFYSLKAEYVGYNEILIDSIEVIAGKMSKNELYLQPFNMDSLYKVWNQEITKTHSGQIFKNTIKMWQYKIGIDNVKNEFRYSISDESVNNEFYPTPIKDIKSTKWTDALQDSINNIELTYGIHLSKVNKPDKERTESQKKDHFKYYSKKFIDLGLLKDSTNLKPLYKAYYFGININKITELKNIGIDLYDLIVKRDFNFNNYKEAVLISHLITETESYDYRVDSTNNTGFVFIETGLHLKKIYKGKFYIENNIDTLRLFCDFMNFNPNYLKLELTNNLLRKAVFLKPKPIDFFYTEVIDINLKKFSNKFHNGNKNLVFLQNKHEDDRLPIFYKETSMRYIFGDHVFMFNIQGDSITLGANKYPKKEIIETIENIIKINDSDNFFNRNFK